METLNAIEDLVLHNGQPSKIQAKKGRGGKKSQTAGPSFSELREKVVNTSGDQFELGPTLKTVMTILLKVLEDQQIAQQRDDEREKEKVLEEKLRIQEEKNKKLDKLLDEQKAQIRAQNDQIDETNQRNFNHFL